MLFNVREQLRRKVKLKIFIYSDLHISKTSSILPLTFDDVYTYRQNMIIETGKFLVKQIKELNPDIIVNLGDTFDNHTLTSYDVNTASEFFKCFEDVINIPHYVLVGNHDMLNSKYNAVDLLDNINNIQVIKEPITLYDNLAFMPYVDKVNINNMPEGTFLFSHLDIEGSTIRNNILLKEGISTKVLKEKYKLVFNGHIHRAGILDNVVNVGSITTHSFSDANDSVPQCYIFDTDTMDLNIIQSHCCPLFRKYNPDNMNVDVYLDELEDYLSNLDLNYLYIIQCVCPYELKESVRELLADTMNVVCSKLSIKFSNEAQKVDKNKQDIEVLSNVDIVKSFKEFIATVDLKYSADMYLKVLDGIEVK